MRVLRKHGFTETNGEDYNLLWSLVPQYHMDRDFNQILDTAVPKLRGGTSLPKLNITRLQPSQTHNHCMILGSLAGAKDQLHLHHQAMEKDLKKHYGSKRTTVGGEVHQIPWWSTDRLKGIYQVRQALHFLTLTPSLTHLHPHPHPHPHPTNKTLGKGRGGISSTNHNLTDSLFFNLNTG
jgi:hypothetical protein